MALLSYTYDFLTLTGSIVAANIGQNFADVAAVLNGGIRAENIAADAAIRSNQIADRFGLSVENVDILEPSSDATIDGSFTSGDFTVTTATAIAWKTWRVKAPTGKQKFLCGISMFAASVTTNNFEVTVYRNGTLITGATFVFAPGTDQYVEQENTSMFDAPFAAFVHNDEIQIRIRATTANSVVRGCSARFHWKTEQNN